MAELSTEVVTPGALDASDRAAMLAIMARVYDGIDRAHFEADLAGKDEVIVLRAPGGELAGFSTQQFMTVATTAGAVTGVFSGDTVIAPEHWGSPALFQAFARRYIIERPAPWYWFLISKGHRTYRMLPTFFTEYWPSRHAPTPAAASEIMAAYARARYGDQYDPTSGVLAYREPRDRLRDGVAGLTEQVLRNPDAAFFASANPGHELGHDLVCLAELSPAKLRPAHRARLLGTS